MQSARCKFIIYIYILLVFIIKTQTANYFYTNDLLVPTILNEPLLFQMLFSGKQQLQKLAVNNTELYPSGMTASIIWQTRKLLMTVLHRDTLQLEMKLHPNFTVNDIVSKRPECITDTMIRDPAQRNIQLIHRTVKVALFSNFFLLYFVRISRDHLCRVGANCT